VNVFDWIEQELAPTRCNSETFFYDEMESQSGYCLPIIYRPFDSNQRMHWRERGSAWDYFFSMEGEGKRLLDFGPGDGWPSLIVAPFVAEVVGVEGSRKRVEVCTANAERLGIDNARFVYVEPGSELPFEEGTFDGVMAATSVEQTPDPQATLREFYRVLRPGGRLRISYEALERYRGGAKREVKLHERAGDTCWLTLFDRHIEEEYARMVRLALAMERAEARRLFPGEARHLAFSDVTVALLKEIRPSIVEARICTLTHPSGRTLAEWMREIGFREVRPTHSGAWFAGQLFDRLPAEARPTNLDEVDAMLRPLVEVVVQMAAPVGTDPMITAVK
jgi:ubiquinone/menaquinone biosynthesis C-methylase UbiE